MLNTDRARADQNVVNEQNKTVRFRWVLFVAIAWLMGPSSTVVWGQTYLNGVGVPTYTTKVPIENGFIDASTGRIHLEIPVGVFSQRPGRQFKAVLMYDSNIWSFGNSSGSTSLQPTNVSTSNGAANSWGGWRLVTSGDTGNLWTAALPVLGCTLYPFFWYEPNGTVHVFEFNPAIESGPAGCPAIPAGNGLANDGTGYTISVTNYNQAKVYAPDGTQVYPTVEDPNGNYYSMSSGNVVDTLGRTPITTTVSGSTITYAVLNSLGGTSTYTVTTESIPVNTNFGQSGYTEYSGNITTVQSIQMPDGTSYSFTYDSGSSSGHYGLLKSMTLPSGGTVSYTWAIFSDAYGDKYTWINSRTTPDSTTPWTYSPSLVTTCGSGQVNCKQQFQVAKPSGDNTVYTFVLNGGAWSGEVQYYTGSVSSSNLLATVNQCFSFVTVSGGTCSYNVTTTTPALFVLKTINSTILPVPSGSNISTTTAYTWSSDTYSGYTGGSFGNVTKIQEWNFGSSPSGSPDRSTNISYLSGSGYVGAHIFNRPTGITTTNGAGVTVRQTNYCYDYSGGCGGSSFANVSTVQHDSAFGTTYTTRGDLTQTQKLVGSTTYLTSSSTFDITGQIVSSKDFNSNSTSYAYSTSYANAYLTTIQNALSQSTTLAYNFNTGLLTSATDPNSQTTSFSYDVMGRLLTTSYPDGGQSSNGFNYSGSTFTGRTVTTKITSSQNEVDTENLDGMGRASSQSLVSDPAGQSTVATSYDSDSRVYSVSNPHRSTSLPSDGTEYYFYDGLDRVMQTTHADSSTLKIYFGAAVTSSGAGGRSTQVCSGYGTGYPILFKDEAGDLRQTWTDAFGRLIEVDEPDPSSGSLSSPSNSCYAYDLNNNLSSAVSGSQTRSFSYDNLSRLTQETLPESGTAYFYYTTSGGGLCAGDPMVFCRRIDARSITTTYTYDVLNRLTLKAYSDGTSSAGFYYDANPYAPAPYYNGIGRVVHMTNFSNSSKSLSYDSMGRVTDQWNCTEGYCAGGMHHTQAAYDLAGDLNSLIYPSGRDVTYQFNNAMQPTQVRFDNLNSNSVGYNFLSSAGYSPIGYLTSATFGNGVVDASSYNSRFELASRLVSMGSSTYFNLTYNYNSSGNNGNVASISDGVDSGRNETFTYDALSRMVTASTSGSSLYPAWGLSWTYDRYGNRWAQSVTAGVGPSNSVSVSATTNHISTSGYSYDASGNMTSDGANTFAFDAENRAEEANSWASVYVQGPSGQRTFKQTGTVLTDYIYFNNRVIAEYDGGGAARAEYVYAGNKLLASMGEASNGGFENGMTGWNPYTGASIVTDATKSHSGSNYLQISTSTGSDAESSTDIPVTVGEVIAFGGWVYRESGSSGYANWQMIALDSTHTPVAYPSGTPNNVTAAAWTPIIGIYTVPSGVAFVRLYCQVSLVTGATVARFDDGFISAGSQYFHQDHLSNRLITDTTGAKIGEQGHFPFGEMWYANNATTKWEFGSYENDSDTGNSYALARYDVNRLGRFLSADPLGGNLTDPQALNPYSYTRNNPVNLADPNGLFFLPPEAGGPCIPCDIGIGIFDIFSLLELFGHAPPPVHLNPPQWDSNGTFDSNVNDIPDGVIFGAQDGQTPSTGSNGHWWDNIWIRRGGVSTPQSLPPGTGGGIKTEGGGPKINNNPWPQPTTKQPPDVGVPKPENIPSGEAMGEMPWIKWAAYALMRIVGGAQEIFVPVIVEPNGGCYPRLPCHTGSGQM